MCRRKEKERKESNDKRVTSIPVESQVAVGIIVHVHVDEHVRINRRRDESAILEVFVDSLMHSGAFVLKTSIDCLKATQRSLGHARYKVRKRENQK